MGNDEILRAVVKLVSTRGPEATSVRNVATEAGVSVGAVQYYYRTKDELLAAAMSAMNQTFIEVAEKLLDGIDDPKRRLRVFILLLAATHDQAREGAIIWTVFAARASVNEGLRRQHTQNWAEAEAKLLELMQAAYPEQNITADDAALLLAAADGVAVARAAENPERMTPTRAEKLIDLALQRWEQ